MFCYLVTIGGSTLISGLVASASWHFQPTFLKTYVSLFATIPGGLIVHGVANTLSYIEIVKVIWHIRQLTLIPFTLASCLRNETVFSTVLVRTTPVLSDLQLSNINAGVVDIATKFTNVNESQYDLREDIKMALQWLEKRGLGCQQIISMPFETCLNATEVAKRNCLKSELKGLCELVTVSEFTCSRIVNLSRTMCQDIGPEKTIGVLSNLRIHVSNMISGVIWMRVGVLIELSISSKVANRLWQLWTDDLQVLLKEFGKLNFIYEAVAFSKYVGILVAIVWPIAYLFFYTWGPLSFDNEYFLTCECLEETSTEGEIDLVKNYWIPTCNEIYEMFRKTICLYHLVFVCILVLDVYYTNWVNGLHDQLTKLYHYYQQSIVPDVEVLPDLTGVSWIEATVIQHLRKLQEAMGLHRLLSCNFSAPPAIQSYNVFIFAFVQRLVFIFVQTKWRYLYSLICARFFRRKHNLRMFYLNSKVCLKIKNP